MAKRAILPNDIKNQNTEQISYYLGANREVTIQEISDHTGISRQTVKKTVEAFLENGYLQSLGKGDSTAVGGKKPERYGLNGDFCYVGVTAFENKCSYKLSTLLNEQIDEVISGFYDSFTIDEYMKEFQKNIESLLKRNNVQPLQFCGIVMGMGGIMDNKEGIIKYNATVTNWGRNIRMRELVQKNEGLASYLQEAKIVIDNTAKISALSLMFEEGYRNKRVAVVYFDKGIAINILENGRSIASKHGLVGELGHMVIDMNDEAVCGCGSRGCFESLMKEERIAEKIRKMSNEQSRAMMDSWDKKLDIRLHVLQCAEQGNSVAIEMSEYMALVIGTALRNVMFLADPDVMIIQGSFAGCSEEFLKRIKQKIWNNYIEESFPIEIICDKRNLENLQALGATNLIVKKILNDEE